MADARMTERVAFEGALAGKLAAVTLVAGVVIVLAGQSPWATAPEGQSPEPAPLAEVAGGPTQSDEEPYMPFPEMIGAAMELFPNAPKAPPPPDEPDTPPDRPADPTGPAVSGRQVAFLGAILGPRTNYAIIQINDRQVWIPAGESREGIEVLEVTEAGARVRYEDGRETDLKQGERQGGSLTVLRPASGSPGMARPGVAPGVVNAPGAASAVNNDDQDRRVMDLQERRARRLEELEEQRRRLAEQRGEGGR
ncbi:MAG: hypothetical protein ACF8SC_07465 [Phycisphaerales bacterium JB037]